MTNLLARIIRKYHSTLAYHLHRRMLTIQTPVPIISFTFDDAPKTAFDNGGAILRSHGAEATFFVSMGLNDSQTEVGPIASTGDLLAAVEEGHEFGCHTYDHLDPWKTSTDRFLESVVKNKQALDRILPGAIFKTFAYPIRDPKPSIKFQLEQYFICCRGGGQTINAGMADLNLLKAYFLDRRIKTYIDVVRRMIDHNTLRRGWLIFATHDVTDNPSPYGCTPKFFWEVVEYAAHSGALLLPIGKACEKLQAATSDRTALK